MHVFLTDLAPRSVNAKQTQKYKQGILEAFKRYCGSDDPLTGDLYGVVYYFHNVPTRLDADNMSKPVWDALQKAAYRDDGAIKLRSAGIFDLRSEPIEILDLSDMPDSVWADFIKMIDKEKHILYVEVGSLDYRLFRFDFARKSEA